MANIFRKTTTTSVRFSECGTGESPGRTRNNKGLMLLNGVNNSHAYVCGEGRGDMNKERRKKSANLLLVEGTDGEGEGWVGFSLEKAGNTDVVSNDGSDDTEDTASLVDVGTCVESASGENGESDSEEEEQHNEADALSETDDAEVPGDDRPGNQVDTNSRGEFSRVSVGSDDAASGDEDGRVRQPENTVGGECGCTEGVSFGELPHTREELGESTAEDSHTNYNIGVRNIAC